MLQPRTTILLCFLFLNADDEHYGKIWKCFSLQATEGINEALTLKIELKENFISFSFQGDDGDVNVALIIFNNTTTYLILLKRVLKHYLPFIKRIRCGFSNTNVRRDLLHRL